MLIDKLDSKLQNFNVHDITRDACMLRGSLAYHGYDWWWHNFTGISEVTGKERTFFVEFFLINPELSEDQPVFGQLEENKRAGKKPSYLMVKAGSWGDEKAQLHRFFAWKDVSIHWDAPYEVEADDCYASETELRGNISISKQDADSHPEWMCDAGEMSWKLHMRKEIAFNVGPGASKPLRDAEAFQMYWHAEGMKTEYEGEVIFQGEKYRVSPARSYGYADKNWGKDFTSPWVWLSSNCLTSTKTGQKLQNSVFDIGGGRPKIYHVALDRRLLGVMYYEGKEYDFNFSNLPLQVHTKFSFREDEEFCYWHIRQENIDAVMDTKVRCRKKDMLFVNYEAPDGEKRYSRLWNGGNGEGVIKLYERRGRELELIDEIQATHVGCEYGEYDQET